MSDAAAPAPVEAPAPATGKSPKAKAVKVSKPKVVRAKKASTGPKTDYVALVKEAIVALKERGGSSSPVGSSRLPTA